MMTKVKAISPAGLELIKQFEGFLSHAYQDSTGVWTIGYGTTNGAGVVNVMPSLTCTVAEATQWLEEFVNKSVAPAIVATGADLNQNQFDALCSLGYNLGDGCFESTWTIGANLRAHNLAAASQAFLLYDEAGGVVLQGLVNRRHAEQKLFDTPVKPTPKPPEPTYHYDWYDNTQREWTTKGVKHSANEQGTVREYDKKIKHPTLNRKRLKILKANCADLATRLHVIELNHANMKLFHRDWRLEQLTLRSQGKVAKKTK